MNMKKLLGILVLGLLLITPSQADDIRDFQIEEMSVGDSLLDHFSEEKIEEGIRYNYFQSINDKTFIISEINSDSFNIYEGVQIVFKRNDKKYKIYGMHGIIFYGKNINHCYDKLKEISYDISNNINYELRDDFNDIEMSGDRGKYTGTTFFLNKGIISIHCTDWAKKIENERNWTDNLRVNIKTDEYENFLRKD